MFYHPDVSPNPTHKMYISWDLQKINYFVTQRTENSTEGSFCLYACRHLTHNRILSKLKVRWKKDIGELWVGYRTGFDRCTLDTYFIVRLRGRTAATRRVDVMCCLCSLSSFATGTRMPREIFSIWDRPQLLCSVRPSSACTALTELFRKVVCIYTSLLWVCEAADPLLCKEKKTDTIQFVNV